AGLPPGNGLLLISSITQNASLLNLTWTGPTGQFQVQKATNLSQPLWQDVAGPTTNRSSSLPITDLRALYRLRQFRPDIQTGELPNSEEALPSKQILRSAGQQIQFSGRPVDLAFAPDGQTLYLKNMTGLLLVDVPTWRLLSTSAYPGSGASMHGIAVSPDGSHVYVSGAGNELYDWTANTNQTVAFSRTISLPSGSYPCGIALSADGATAYVCLSIANSLAVGNLTKGASHQIGVGLAPWDVVLSPNGSTAYVSDWGGLTP